MNCAPVFESIIQLSELSQHSINFLRQRKITHTDSASIMRGQPDFYAIVDIEPFGMVIGFFGDDGNLCHKSERLREILKLNMSI